MVLLLNEWFERKFPAGLGIGSELALGTAIEMKSRLCLQQLLDTDRQLAHADAGRVVHRVGNRGGGPDVRELAETFDTGGIDVVVDLGNQNDLHLVDVGIHRVLYMLLWRIRRGEITPAYYAPLEVVGIYWSFVDAVWLFLFPCIYLVGRS